MGGDEGGDDVPEGTRELVNRSELEGAEESVTPSKGISVDRFLPCILGDRLSCLRLCSCLAIVNFSCNAIEIGQRGVN